MIGLKRFFAFSMLVVFADLYSQDMADTVLLRTINVIDSAQRAVSGNMAYEFDSASMVTYSAQNSGTFLQHETGIFVKNYGPGSSSSLTYRGGTASHTKVYWEGLNIDNAMLGQSDASLLMIGPDMGLEFLKSGNSLSVGAGGFGGILNFHPGQHEWEGLKLGAFTEAASFGRNTGQLNLFWGNGKMKFESYLSGVLAENNFQYRDYIDNDEVKFRENATSKQIQWIPKLSFKIGEKSEFYLSSWITESERQIPSAIGTANGGAIQNDRWKKFLIGWNYREKAVEIDFKSSLMRDELYYRQPNLGIESNNNVESSKSLLSLRLGLGNHWQNEIQLKGDFYRVVSNNYSEDINDQNIGINESLNYHRRRFFFSAALRMEKWQNSDAAFMPSFRIAHAPIASIPNLTVFTDLSYNVRFPSFNERFWQDLGNVNLDQEKSRSAELGTSFKKKNSHLDLHMQLSAFASNVSDLIAWIPDNSMIWRPINLSRVLNRGLETELTIHTLGSGIQLHGFANYIYTISENQNENETRDGQLIYVPMHKFSCRISLNYASYFLQYRQVITSSLRVNSDLSNNIPLSSPISLEVGKNIRFKSNSIELSAGVDNVLNESYQYVQHMPMPLRYYRLSIKYNLNQQ
ncbi:MAG: TonB-dependent receptor [Vicingaceae bacterium]